MTDPSRSAREMVAKWFAREDWPCAPKHEQAAWVEKHWRSYLSKADAVLRLAAQAAPGGPVAWRGALEQIEVKTRIDRQPSNVTEFMLADLNALAKKALTTPAAQPVDWYCPFCKSIDGPHVYTVEDFTGGRAHFEKAYVQCEECEARGPACDSDAEAVAKWKIALAARPPAGRDPATIEACVNAARKGFEEAMEQYVMIGPSGMAMRMINSIRALASKGK